MAGQGPDQRAAAALRPQVRVDREQRALAGGLRADPDHARGQPGGGVQCGVFGLARSRLGDEDHVHVAGVVELAAAALAHADHRKPGRCRAGRQLRPGHRQGRLERGRSQVGELGRGLVQGDRAGQIPGRQVQQRAAVGGAEHPGGTRAGLGRGLGVAGGRAHRLQQDGPQFLRRGTAQRTLPAQRPPVPRVPGQVVGQRRARAEHGGQAAGERGLLRRGGAQAAAVSRLQQPGQPGQRQVRVGRVGEHADELAVEPELADHAFGPGGVGEAQPGQPARQRRPARRVRAIAHVGTVVENGAAAAGGSGPEPPAASVVSRPGAGTVPRRPARRRPGCRRTTPAPATGRPRRARPGAAPAVSR